MNVFTRVAHCNVGCSATTSTSPWKPMRAVKSFLGLGSPAALCHGATLHTHRSSFNLSDAFMSVVGMLSLLVLTALLVLTLFSDDYGRAMQVQAAGYSALSDKVASSTVWDSPRDTGPSKTAFKHAQAGL